MRVVTFAGLILLLKAAAPGVVVAASFASVDNETGYTINVNGVDVDSAGLPADSCYKFPISISHVNARRSIGIVDTGARCTAVEGKEGAWKFSVKEIGPDRSKDREAHYCLDVAFGAVGYAKIVVVDTPDGAHVASMSMNTFGGGFNGLLSETACK